MTLDEKLAEAARNLRERAGLRMTEGAAQKDRELADAVEEARRRLR